MPNAETVQISDFPQKSLLKILSWGFHILNDIRGITTNLHTRNKFKNLFFIKILAKTPKISVRWALHLKTRYWKKSENI